MLRFFAVAPARITASDVRRIAKLANLDLDEAQIEQFARQLDSILAYFQQLRELDTEGVEPTSHVLDLVNVFRQDATRPSLHREEAVANAPDEEAGQFKVPLVI